jgi:hypothetical protein
MVALAEEVGNMVPLVGGPAHAECLVPLLEALAKEEETVVRDAAVDALCKVGSTFSREQALEHLVPCIKVRSLVRPLQSVQFLMANTRHRCVLCRVQENRNLMFQNQISSNETNNARCLVSLLLRPCSNRPDI